MSSSCGACPAPTRRGFLATGMGALASRVLLAQQPKAGRVDFHHHFMPPRHLEKILAQRESGRPPEWSAARSLEEMDRNGVATAVVSLVQPGTWFGDIPTSRSMARYCNDYGAQLASDHAGRFGFFAAIPLPDTEGSLREIEYALDKLHADGIGLMTQFDGKYLGDAAFTPVFEELNRRKAVVYTHPTQPQCCQGLVKGVTVSTIEYATDTTRTIASLVFSGTAARFPDIRFIFSHGGGTVPFLLGRFERLAAAKKDSWLADGAAPALRKFYYEIAQANHPGALDALTARARVERAIWQRFSVPTGVRGGGRPGQIPVQGRPAQRDRARQRHAPAAAPKSVGHPLGRLSWFVADTRPVRRSIACTAPAGHTDPLTSCDTPGTWSPRRRGRRPAECDTRG